MSKLLYLYLYDSPDLFLPILQESTNEVKEEDEERAETSSPEAEKSQNVEEGASAAQAVQVRFEKHEKSCN